MHYNSSSTVIVTHLTNYGILRSMFCVCLPKLVLYVYNQVDSSRLFTGFLRSFFTAIELLSEIIEVEVECFSFLVDCYY